MVNRKEPPQAQMLTELALTTPEVKQLSNELSVHVIADDTNPVIKIDMLYSFGKMNETVPGQAIICSKMITEVTKSFEKGELQEKLDHYGAHLDVAVDYDNTIVSMLCLREHAQMLIPILKSVVTEAVFEQKIFDKIKLQQRQKLQVNNQKNAIIAGRALRNNLLKGTPYAYTLNEKDLDQLDIKDVQAYYDEFYGQKPEIILAGDCKEDVIEVLDKHFGILDFESNNDQYEGRLTPNIINKLINREGSVQASIRMGAISISRNHPDYFDLSIANEILGGYFGSRLMKNIREDKGYTYGIYSVLLNYRHVDYHIIGADVKIDHVEDAVKEVYKEIELMKSTLVSDEELDTVKNYMLGKIASSLDTVFHQSENYKAKLSEGADYLDYFDHYIERIQKINPERILDISKKYFDNNYCVIKVA